MTSPRRLRSVAALPCHGGGPVNPVRRKLVPQCPDYSPRKLRPSARSDLDAGLHAIPLDLPDGILLLPGGEVLEDVGPSLLGGSKQREVQAQAGGQARRRRIVEEQVIPPTGARRADHEPFHRCLLLASFLWGEPSHFIPPLSLPMTVENQLGRLAASLAIMVVPPRYPPTGREPCHAQD